MQRRASRTRGATNAAVGHASRQALQLPQRSASNGRSASSGASVKVTPMKVNEPISGRMSIVFLPIQPSPARCASSRSGTGPAST